MSYYVAIGIIGLQLGPGAELNFLFLHSCGRIIVLVIITLGPQRLTSRNITVLVTGLLALAAAVLITIFIIAVFCKTIVLYYKRNSWPWRRRQTKYIDGECKISCSSYTMEQLGYSVEKFSISAASNGTIKFQY